MLLCDRIDFRCFCMEVKCVLWRVYMLFELLLVDIFVFVMCFVLGMMWVVKVL